ncbi:MAG: hypothetical protein ACTSXX_01700, partial [Candidatus Baldrarchaeia archaeon]
PVFPSRMAAYASQVTGTLGCGLRGYPKGVLADMFYRGGSLAVDYRKIAEAVRVIAEMLTVRVK